METVKQPSDCLFSVSLAGVEASVVRRLLGLLVSSVLGTAPEPDTEAVDMREVAGAANMMGISLETVNKTR